MKETMKQVKIESIIMLFVLMMFLVVSCGSDDSGNKTPQDSQVTNERTGAVSQLCNMFGINADDYYDYWMPYTKDDKVVISLANKKTNRLLVAIYDTNKKSVIYTNTDIPFLTTLNITQVTQADLLLMCYYGIMKRERLIFVAVSLTRLCVFKTCIFTMAPPLKQHKWNLPQNLLMELSIGTIILVC